MPLLVNAIKTKRLAVVDGGVNLMNLSYIDNVVQGVMLAAASDKSIGHAYNITDGSKVTTKRSFPYVPAYVAAYVCELYSRFRRYKVSPPITRYTVRVGKYDQVFDISRAMYELGYKPKVNYKQAMTGMTRYVRSLYYGQK